ncbi:sigma-54-dependent Fis family transcriptional regulator [candidate division KSB1 bacterium]|nr:MAG: sigma-54-dependent Fis family transcriptional regulator [candidate division KSB1 bacterium]MBC6946502.1 sigma-54-dependent Fis family transcriptional regulator [candidate division KSB1 bacterium]MCE7940502.1 sigma-54-dependent Fis family transcriptional regulator [Chlorobi bacterium CHB1]
MTPAKILIVDDEEDIREELSKWLNDVGYKTSEAASGNAALALARRMNFDAVLLDLRLPDLDGFEVLQKLHEDYPDICIIVLTGYGTEDSPARARQFGAFDFFEKQPLKFERLITRIDASIQQFRLQRESFYQQEEVRRQYSFENIIGESDAMRRMFDLIRKVAETEETILIQGESGTGKELVARAIHFNSPRKQKAFIIVDCSALQENLAESELFGHEKGAFTSAFSRRAGKFERAHLNTLFLDEIGELPLPLQIKFFRFLQERTFERLGGVEQLEVDVRIIAATNLKLAEAVTQGKFREELYHRLNRFPIEVPPLRERHGDIPLLVRHFLKTCGRSRTKAAKDISPAALKLLENYHFPGNVRELENIVASAILLEESEVIQPEVIRLRLAQPIPEMQTEYADLPYKDAKEQFDKAYFLQVLKRFNHNVSKTAEFAQMDRSHVFTKLKNLGLRNNGES